MTGRTMRAAIYRGKGNLEVVEIAMPPVGPPEVRVAAEDCRVCGTDLPDGPDGVGGVGRSGGPAIGRAAGRARGSVWGGAAT